MKISINLYLSKIFFILLCTPSLAHAGSITMLSEPEFEVSITDETIQLVGQYVVTNKGDETAYGVFPLLQLSTWQWVGEPQTLPTNQSFTWKISRTFSPKELFCKSGDSCEKIFIPKGYLPLLSRVMYADLGGHSFSAPHVNYIKFGEFTENEKVIIQTHGVEGQIEISPGTTILTGKITIRNYGNTKRTFNVNVFTARELLPKLQESMLTLESLQSKTINFTLENLSALSQSVYGVFAIVSWEESGITNATVFSTTAKIEAPNKATYLWYALLAVLLTTLIAFFVLKWSNKKS